MVDLLAMRSIVELDEEDRQIDALAAPIALTGRWNTSLNDLRRMHLRLYNLLGDPATRINLPSEIAIDVAVLGSRLTADVPGMVKGAAQISVELPRTSPTRASEFQQVVDGNDPDLESKAAWNYPLANNRVLAHTTAAVVDGRLDVTFANLDEITGNVIIRIEARGQDASGRNCTAIGAVSHGAVEMRPGLHTP
jgi:hypothetical protein